MGLNKQKGNMYPWVTDTWNPIRGKCPHNCVYCYMKVYPQPELHFVDKEMKTDLGTGRFIFVGSSTDMWLGELDWIIATLTHCGSYPENRYLFQSKAPAKFNDFKELAPLRCTLGTTIETNRDYHLSQAPSPRERMLAMCKLAYPKMVSIEPIIDFDFTVLVGWIENITPDFVSIGADSKGHHLSEPSPDKVELLIERLSTLTKVKVKPNLARLRQ